jgi:hypothetical protein
MADMGSLGSSSKEGAEFTSDIGTPDISTLGAATEIQIGVASTTGIAISAPEQSEITVGWFFPCFVTGILQ